MKIQIQSYHISMARGHLSFALHGQMDEDQVHCRFNVKAHWNKPLTIEFPLARIDRGELMPGPLDKMRAALLVRKTLVDLFQNGPEIPDALRPLLLQRFSTSS